MMKQRIRIAAIAIVVIVLVSCRNPLQAIFGGLGGSPSSAGSAMGSIHLVFSAPAARTVVPDFASQIDSYQVTVTSNDGFAGKTKTVAPPATSADFSEVEAGSWNIGVIAKKGGTTIGTGSADDQSVVANQTSAVTIPMSFAPSTGGSGDLKLTISLPTSTGIDWVSGSVDGAMPLTPAFTTSGSTESALFAASGLSSGSHVLVMTFRRGGRSGTVAGVFREAVDIWDNATSGAWVASNGQLQSVFSFSASDFYSSNARLAGLELSCGTINFSSDVTDYTLNAVSPGYAQMTIDPTGSVNGQSIQYEANGAATWATVQSGAVSSPIDLQTGANTIKVEVTAPDRQSTATYTLTVSVPSSPALVINELASGVYTARPSVIELYNESASAVNLGDYSIRAPAYRDDGSTYPSAGVKTFSLPAVSIPSRGYLVIRSDVMFHLTSSDTKVYLTDGDGDYPWFSGASGFVELLDSSQHHTVDFVRWGDDPTPPSAAGFVFTGSAAGVPADSAHIGYSLARDAAGTETYSASDWTVRAWATLGGPNDVTSDTDADGDGIPDSAEAVGGTFAGLPLYQWGARQNQKDIFIYVDYMDSTDPGIIPQKAAFDKLTSVFLAHGIHLHFDVGDLYSSTPGDTANYNLDGRSHRVPFADAIGFYGDPDYKPGYADAYQYRSDYLPSANERAFFYMLFSNVSPDASGLGGGNIALVMLGNTGLNTDTQAETNRLINTQAAVAMHEFGHDLGLQHGGGPGMPNYKPNYLSDMNYLYGVLGLPTIGTDDDTRFYYQYEQKQGTINQAYASRIDQSNWVAPPTADPSQFRLDYSEGTAGDIDENHVDDTKGIMLPGALPIDFGMTGSPTNTDHAVDILAEIGEEPSPGLVVLHDFNDWAAIDSLFQRQFVVYAYGAQPSGTVSLQSVARPPSMRMIFDNPRPRVYIDPPLSKWTP